MRLNRFLAEAGLFSRREADRMIELGLVMINGEKAVLGQQVEAVDVVTYEGRIITPIQEKIYLALHKPKGIEVTMNLNVEGNVADFLNIKERVFPVGRLDKDSEGLLLFMNDGDTANAVLKAANAHEKEYLVTVNRTITDGFLAAMEKGVPILDTITAPCYIERVTKDTFKIILTQGLNRQIRRMCEALGYEVKRLVRVRIMHIELGDLAVGKWRKLTEDELKTLLTDTKI